MEGRGGIISDFFNPVMTHSLPLMGHSKQNRDIHDDNDLINPKEVDKKDILSQLIT